MSDEYPVEREDGANKGRYVIRFPEGLEAEMTYQKRGPGVIAIDHTFTPPELRGRNIAARLMNALIDDARREGTKIKPYCSYAVTQFQRHKEWADLLA
ncbi:MAG: GNAT family N-acetyltransferase [Devosia sp.]